MTSALLPIFLAYLVGGFPIGLLAGHIAQGIDVRKFGSGNIGASNVWRTVGWKWGLAVFVLDVVKGFWPVLASHHVPHAAASLPVLVGLAAIAGHNFSPFLGFKGGKGVATSLGVALGLQWLGALIGFGAWGLVLLATRYISVASVVATIVATFLIWWLNGRQLAYGAFGILTTASVIFKHIPNMKRVRAGTEPKVREKKKVVANTTEIPPKPKATS